MENATTIGNREKYHRTEIVIGKSPGDICFPREEFLESSETGFGVQICEGDRHLNSHSTGTRAATRKP